MPNTVGQKMSEYTPLSSLTEEQQRTYLSTANVTTFGEPDGDGVKKNINVPLASIVPSVPVTDVTVGGTSVVSNGVAALPAIPTVPVTDVTVDGTSVLNNGVAEITMPSVPTASSLAGTGLTANAETNKVNVWLDNSTIGIIGSGGDAGKIEVKNPVPSVGNGHANVGKVLTVVSDGNTDSVAWSDVPAELPTVGTSVNQGKVLTVNSSDQVVWDEPAGGLPDTTGHSQGDVLTIGVSGPNWIAPVHIPIIGTINISPTPSYNYIILQNFLDGHTIGTPISEEDYSDFNNTYPADKSAIGWTWESNWSDTNLVSTTAGSQLLYSEAGFDFSKYGLTTGQIPFGFINADWEWHMGAGYRDITLPTEFTYEVWFNNPNNDWEGTFTAFYKENWDALKIVMDDERTYIMFGDTIFSVDRYEPQGGGYIYEPDQATYEKAFPLSAGQWHHFALSCDGTNLYVFIDGKLLGNIVIANINGLAEFLTTAMKEIDVVVDDFDRGQSCVYLAQLALCDSCKWTSDFELPKEAY